jgi:hypothetical protein
MYGYQFHVSDAASRQPPLLDELLLLFVPQQSIKFLLLDVSERLIGNPVERV